MHKATDTIGLHCNKGQAGLVCGEPIYTLSAAGKKLYLTNGSDVLWQNLFILLILTVFQVRPGQNGNTGRLTCAHTKSVKTKDM